VANFFFYNFYILHTNYQINLKKFRKLTQVKLCCLFLIETSFEVKTQFECHAAYKLTISNHIGDVSISKHRT
jgi:hypothetical protein